MTVQTAWAQDHSGTTDDGLTWELTQDGNGHYTVLTITGTGDMKNYGHTTVDNIWKTNAPWGYYITSVTIVNGGTVNATGGNGDTPSNSRGHVGLGGAGINGSLTVNGGIVTVSGGSGGTGGKGYKDKSHVRGYDGGNGGNGGAGISDALTVSGGTVNTYGGSGGEGGEDGGLHGGNNGEDGSAGPGLGSTVTSSSATAYIQESDDKITWSNMTSNSISIREFPSHP